MTGAINSLWIIVPSCLSAVFAGLFFPIVRRTYELPLSLLFTFLGICVIWVSYLVRAHIFSSWSDAEDEGG